MRPRVFPAEDVARIGARQSAARASFNEAAGIPRGKRQRAVFAECAANASMRPRVFPAEDAELQHLLLDRPAASMRPRVFPAEDAVEGLERSHPRRLQ